MADRPARQLYDRPGTARASPPATLLGALAVATVAAAVVAAVHAEVFAHLSSNHDEAVYLQQAAMLLEGRLEMHAGPLAEAVRPWFFVRDGGRLYPKYAPVAAAAFALGEALTGSYAAALPAVAFANVLLCYLVAAAAFDRRTGLLSAALLAASPLFVVTSSVFLSYAPTTALNLLFALGYVRATRRESRRWAALAGVAVGLAFFSRPYTAVLFSAPFVAHAVGSLAATWRRHGRAALVDPLRRNGVVAAVGLAFVGVTLAYNWRLTGDPLLFPYEAFAPRDGIGFGRREILGHEVRYTPALALRANALVLWALLTEWFAAPPVGALAAAAGAGAVLADLRSRWRSAAPGDVTRSLADGLPDATLRVLLVGVFLSVAAGNVAFWGNYNVLGRLSDPNDGLLALFGPFYHFDALLPLSAFAAHGGLLAWDRLAAAVAARTTHRTATLLAAALLVTAPLVAADLRAVEPRLDANAAYTERYEETYAPFEDRTFDRAVVFVPDPYGPWLNHPFQSLRNDPGLDGPVVYARDRDPAGDFAVLDAYPDRTPYRFTYRGEWTPDPGDRVLPRLQRLRVVGGERLRARTTVGVPAGATLSSVRLATDSGTVRYVHDGDAGGELAVRWTVGPDGARITSPGLDPAGEASLDVDGTGTVALSVTVVQPGGATLTYRQELAVEVTPGGVRAVWPPETQVCRLTPDCGREGTYLPDRPDEHVEGVRVETSVNATPS